MDGTEQVLPSGFEPETLALLAPRSNQTELWEQKNTNGLTCTHTTTSMIG